MSIEEAKRKHEASLLAHSGVVSVGIGLHNAQPTIMVGVQSEADAMQANIPDTLEGHPVHITVIGMPTAF